MPKKMPERKVLIFGLIIGLLVVGFLLLNTLNYKNPLANPSLNQITIKDVKPSETSIEYTDPSGFSLSYPDNLSIIKNDIEDNATYADIQLSSKDVSGSINLKISDSEYKTLDEWVKANKGTDAPKEVTLGSLQALEIKTIDRLLLGALDEEIFFSIEIPLIEQEFWMKVYEKVLKGFTFTPVQNAVLQDTSSEDIAFEGEEVIE